MVNKITIEVDNDVVTVTRFDFVGRANFTTVLKALMEAYRVHPSAKIEKVKEISAKKKELAANI